MTDPIKKAYFDTPDGQLHYRTCLSKAATKKDQIVFLHMSASNGGHFAKLMTSSVNEGHDCFAPDMPGCHYPSSSTMKSLALLTIRSFGNSYDLPFQPENTKYYVNIYMSRLSSLQLSRYHIVGHHSGASLGTEIAANHPEQVLSLCVIGIALMAPSEQAYWKRTVNFPFNKPVDDGSHLMKTWKYLEESWGGCGR